MMEFNKLLSDNANDTTVTDVIDNTGLTEMSNGSTIEVLHPHITRKTISIFEYCAVITKLAKYLNSISNLEKYVKEVEINEIINPTELAFNLIEQGKFDAIIDRGYEQVTYSTLLVKQQWKDMIKNYFEQQHKNFHEEMLKPLNLD